MSGGGGTAAPHSAAAVLTPAEKVLNRAVEVLEEGVSADRAANHQLAFDKYQAALDIIFPILPDLPVAEYEEEYADTFRRYGLRPRPP